MRPGLAGIGAVAIVLVAMTTGAAADGALVQRADVSPAKGFTGSAEGVRVEFRISGAPGDVTVRIAGGGREVRRIELPGVQPGTDRTEVWDGLDDSGRLVPDGSYRAIVSVAGGNEREAGTVRLRGHFFPVRAPHGTRGAVGDFRAPRNGGRWHKGFDLTANCGTPLAAARTGTVVRRAFDGRLDGNFVVIKGLRERRWYWYSHMAHPSRFRRGDLVHVGEIVGHIGRTGNAGSTPCHLHFELHYRGRPIDPEPSLRAWDRHS
ncbi:MAG TPA: peptidoglycan DD-metalloendopeptidase family protein [Solirubrobacterales bacterium]